MYPLYMVYQIVLDNIPHKAYIGTVFAIGWIVMIIPRE